MSIRSDISVDFSVSPRIITIAAPSLTVTIQDLNDTVRYLESPLPTGNEYASLAASAGKDVLHGVVKVGITFTLQNALLAFAARAGPATAQCTVTDGNLVAVDAGGAPVNPISPTAFTQVIIEQSTSASLVTSGGAFPPNFSLLSIDAAGRVDLSKWIGAAVNVLIAGRVDANAGVVADKTGYTLTLAEETAIANALLDLTNGIETGFTLRQVQRLIAAVLCGKVSGAPLSPVFRNLQDSASRVASADDVNGNRVAVTLTP